MRADAEKCGWSDDTVLQLTLMIDGEREEAQNRLRRLSGGKGKGSPWVKGGY